MKSYDMILSRVNSLLRFYSKDFVKGYIYGLLDWRVINTDTHKRLDDVINTNENIRIVS